MRCPICKKPVAEPTTGGEKTAYPFCCERCSVIDLGRWLDEKYQIPVTEKDEDDSESDPTDESLS